MLIQAYQYQWPTHFQRLKAALQSSLHPLTLRIEHIGSTAVPGLAAKPIIDMDLIYVETTAFSDILARLEAVGYAHRGDQGITGREVFKRKAGNTPHPIFDTIVHHLYVNHAASQEWQRHVLFRDYLRVIELARTQYQALKYALAEEANQDRKRYAQLKEAQARAQIEAWLEEARALFYSD